MQNNAEMQKCRKNAENAMQKTSKMQKLKAINKCKKCENCRKKENAEIFYAKKKKLSTKFYS